MASPSAVTTNTQTPAKPSPGLSQHYATIFIVAVALIFIVLAKRKGREGLDNPLIDLILVTFGVFALAAVFRGLGNHLSSPGMTTFFSAGTPPTTAPASSVASA